MESISSSNHWGIYLYTWIACLGYIMVLFELSLSLSLYRWVNYRKWTCATFKLVIHVNFEGFHGGKRLAFSLIFKDFSANLHYKEKTIIVKRSISGSCNFIACFYSENIHLPIEMLFIISCYLIWFDLSFCYLIKSIVRSSCSISSNYHRKKVFGVQYDVLFIYFSRR